MTQAPPPPATDEPIPLTAEMQAIVRIASERCASLCAKHAATFKQPDPQAQAIWNYRLLETAFELVAQEAIDAERSRCLAACESEMQGTYGRVRAERIAEKIKEGWEPE